MAILEGRLLEELADLKQQIKVAGYPHVKVSADLFMALSACYDLAVAPMPDKDTEVTGIAISRDLHSARIHGRLYVIRPNKFICWENLRYGRVVAFKDPTTKDLRIVMLGESHKDPVIVATSYLEFWHSFADYVAYLARLETPPLDQQSRLGT